jgi:hypothetical protein
MAQDLLESALFVGREASRPRRLSEQNHACPSQYRTAALKMTSVSNSMHGYVRTARGLAFSAAGRPSVRGQERGQPRKGPPKPRPCRCL